MSNRNIILLALLIGILSFSGLILIGERDKEPKNVSIIISNYSITEYCYGTNLAKYCTEYFNFTYKGSGYRFNIGEYAWHSRYACVMECIPQTPTRCYYEAEILNLTGEALKEACDKRDKKEKECMANCTESPFKPSKNFTKMYPGKVEITAIYFPRNRSLLNCSIARWQSDAESSWLVGCPRLN